MRKKYESLEQQSININNELRAESKFYSDPKPETLFPESNIFGLKEKFTKLNTTSDTINNQISELKTISVESKLNLETIPHLIGKGIKKL